MNALTLLATLTILALPSPELCRDFGVYVPDGARASGEIVEYHISDVKTVSARCQSPWREQRGCAIPVGPGMWVIWAVDDSAVRLHETCHSLYQTAAHSESEHRKRTE